MGREGLCVCDGERRAGGGGVGVLMKSSVRKDFEDEEGEKKR